MSLEKRRKGNEYERGEGRREQRKENLIKKKNKRKRKEDEGYWVR